MVNEGTSFTPGKGYAPFGSRVRATRPRLLLLLRMAHAERRVHHVHDLESKLPVMLALKRAGMVERHECEWKGKLSALGRWTVRQIKGVRS